jgi:hypothetical protein
MRYPYELEWMEGGMVAHVGRVLAGRPLYAPPSLEFVSFLYPPGYYLAAAAVAKLTGLGFFPLRLLSFLSSLSTFAVIVTLAKRETESWTHGLVAAGVFAATYVRAGGWLDLARLDSFYVLLLLGSILALRHATFRGGEVLAGLLFAAAFFTKQSAVVVVVPEPPVRRECRLGYGSGLRSRPRPVDASLFGKQTRCSAPLGLRFRVSVVLKESVPRSRFASSPAPLLKHSTADAQQLCFFELCGS